MAKYYISKDGEENYDDFPVAWANMVAFMNQEINRV